MHMISPYHGNYTVLLFQLPLSLSSLALHPTKNILVTGSDDHTWKVWAVPSGEHLMTGEGHEDWLSSIQFHPRLILIIFIFCLCY